MGVPCLSLVVEAGPSTCHIPESSSYRKLLCCVLVFHERRVGYAGFSVGALDFYNCAEPIERAAVFHCYNANIIQVVDNLAEVEGTCSCNRIETGKNNIGALNLVHRGRADKFLTPVQFEERKHVLPHTSAQSSAYFCSSHADMSEMFTMPSASTFPTHYDAHTLMRSSQGSDVPKGHLYSTVCQRKATL